MKINISIDTLCYSLPGNQNHVIIYFHHLFTIYSLYIHLLIYLFITYSPYIHHLSTAYSPYIHPSIQLLARRRAEFYGATSELMTEIKRAQ
jgi:hypothetical protein